MAAPRGQPPVCGKRSSLRHEGDPGGDDGGSIPPRHAECTGGILSNARRRARDCALARGVLAAATEIVGPVETLVPVDLRLPGCPPSPRSSSTGCRRWSSSAGEMSKPANRLRSPRASTYPPSQTARRPSSQKRNGLTLAEDMRPACRQSALLEKRRPDRLVKARALDPDDVPDSIVVCDGRDAQSLDEGPRNRHARRCDEVQP